MIELLVYSGLFFLASPNSDSNSHEHFWNENWNINEEFSVIQVSSCVSYSKVVDELKTSRFLIANFYQLFEALTFPRLCRACQTRWTTAGRSPCRDTSWTGTWFPTPPGPTTWSSAAPTIARASWKTWSPASRRTGTSTLSLRTPSCSASRWRKKWRVSGANSCECFFMIIVCLQHFLLILCGFVCLIYKHVDKFVLQNSIYNVNHKSGCRLWYFK